MLLSRKSAIASLAIIIVLASIAFVLYPSLYPPLKVETRSLCVPLTASWPENPRVRTSTRIAMVGLVRDARRHWDEVQLQWNEALEAWPQGELFILENGSTDGTAEAVAQWAESHPRVHAKQDYSPPAFELGRELKDTDVMRSTGQSYSYVLSVQRRMHKMRSLREVQHEWLQEYSSIHGCTWDVVCVVDLDQPMKQNLNRWVDAVDVVLNKGYHTIWPRGLSRNVISGFSLRRVWRQYDTFAIECDDVADKPLALMSHTVSMRAKYRNMMFEACEKAREQGSVYDVKSAFGGMGVYAWDAWAAGTYMMQPGYPDEWDAVCEHVLFHHSIRQACPGAKMGIHLDWILSVTR